MYLLLCTLDTSSGVNPASSAYITLVLKSIRKISLYVVNHQAANTELFALGTDIIVASLIFAKQYRVKCYADVKIF
jgi:hypothetical protein